MLGLAAAVVILWTGFLDSHSLPQRYVWHGEAETLRTENQVLTDEIDRLQSELETDLTDEEVERIAREQYGMQRDGETVHPVQKGE